MIGVQKVHFVSGLSNPPLLVSNLSSFSPILVFWVNRFTLSRSIKAHKPFDEKLVERCLLEKIRSYPLPVRLWPTQHTETCFVEVLRFSDSNGLSSAAGCTVKRCTQLRCLFAVLLLVFRSGFSWPFVPSIKRQIFDSGVWRNMDRQCNTWAWLVQIFS